MTDFAPSSVRPRRDWVLVLADPRKKELTSGIILPGHETGVEKVTEGSGTVIRVGPGEKNAALGIEDNCRIVYRGFLRHANRVETTETWESGEVKFYFLMSSEDILCILPEGVEVGVFSGRPSIPSKE